MDVPAVFKQIPIDTRRLKSPNRFFLQLANVELESGKIPTEWLISGSSKTRSKILGRTKDLLAAAVLWEAITGGAPVLEDLRSRNQGI